jgi:hypothetical protein
MSKKILGRIVLLFSINLMAQDSLLIGKKYREDQIYFNVTYNSIIKKPETLTQQGISLGFHTGFVRDIPLNEEGNFALGIGLGYAYDKYQSNLIYNAAENVYALAEEAFNKNKIETHAIEIPFEIRFRTSTPTEYKFWRVYLGGKIAYNVFTENVFKTVTILSKQHHVPFASSLQYGPQLTVGYNAWNLYAFWNSKPLFEKAPFSELPNPNELQNLKFGLQIYMF